MWSYIWTCLIFAVALSIGVSSQSNNYCLRQYKLIKNSDNVIEATSYVDCASSCRMNVTCASASYNRATDMCETSSIESPALLNGDSNHVAITRRRDAATSEYKYHFGFMDNRCDKPEEKLAIVVSSQWPATVHVYSPYGPVDDTINISPSVSLIRQFPLSTEITDWNVKSNKGIVLTASTPLSVFVVDKQPESVGLTYVLPETMLGNQYILDDLGSDAHDYGEVLITGLYDGTIVTFQCRGESNETITLNKHEVYQKLSSNLRGAFVSSSHPVSVHAGNGCGYAPREYQMGPDMMLATLLPVSQLGQLYIVPYMRPRRSCSVSIVSPFDDTTITIEDKAGVVIARHLLNSQDSLLIPFDTTGCLVVKSTKAVMVTQYGHGGESMYGDPSMLTVPSPDHYDSWYSIRIPGNLGFQQPYTLAIVHNEQVSIDDLRLNGQAVIPVETVTVTVTGGIKYHVVYVDLDGYEQITLNSVDTLATFGAFLYVRSDKSEMAATLGFRDLRSCTGFN